MLDVHCLECSRRMAVGEENAGRTGKCPKCGGVLKVPEKTTTPNNPQEPAQRGLSPSSKQEDPKSGRKLKRLVLAILALLLCAFLVLLIRDEMRIRRLDAISNAVRSLVEANSGREKEISVRVESYFVNNYFYKWSDPYLGLGKVEVYVGKEWDEFHYLDRVQAAIDVLLWRSQDEDVILIDGVKFFDAETGRVIATYNPLDGYQATSG